MLGWIQPLMLVIQKELATCYTLKGYGVGTHGAMR